MRGHRVAVLALPDVVPLDLAVPLQTFGPWPPLFVASIGFANPYELVVCAPDPATVPLAGTTVHPVGPALAGADTVIVPGCADPLRPAPPAVRAGLVAAAARGVRLVSTCLGAFTLAEAGLLDGHTVTTHWMWADELAARHPRVRVRADQLYIDDGAVLSSAGVLAAADLCLHLLRVDLGAAASNAMARFLVSAPHREGGQAQYIRDPEAVEPGSLAPTRRRLLDTLAEPHTLRTIAAHAAVSERTLTRRFQAETGESVMGWLTRRRLAAARRALEDTDRPIAVIAAETGFGTPEALRFHFQAALATSPQSYRRTFRVPAR